MPTSKPKVVITGASGFLGSELIKSFRKDGWQVVGLVRNAQKYKTPGVEYVEFDLSKPFDDSAFAGADYLIHAAYVKYDSNNPDAMNINLDGSKRILQASRKHKLKRNVFMSSMSAHSGAESVYGKQKLKIEKLFSGADCAVIRSGLIMGNGGIVKQMADFMKSKHAVPLIGGGKQPLQVIGVYDLVRVIKAILDQKKSGTFTIATPEIYTYKTFYQKLSQRLGIKILYIPVPIGLLLGITKLTATLHLPFSINSDNVLGLKNLRSAETATDLKKLNIILDDLDQILAKTKI